MCLLVKNKGIASGGPGLDALTVTHHNAGKVGGGHGRDACAVGGGNRPRNC